MNKNFWVNISYTNTVNIHDLTLMLHKMEGSVTIFHALSVEKCVSSRTLCTAYSFRAQPSGLSDHASLGVLWTFLSQGHFTTPQAADTQQCNEACLHINKYILCREESPSPPPHSERRQKEGKNSFAFIGTFTQYFWSVNASTCWHHWDSCNIFLFPHLMR